MYKGREAIRQECAAEQVWLEGFMDAKIRFTRAKSLREEIKSLCQARKASNQNIKDSDIQTLWTFYRHEQKEGYKLYHHLMASV